MEDIEIARNTELEKIDKIAENIGIKEETVTSPTTSSSNINNTNKNEKDLFYMFFSAFFFN